jgi:hypothetical protein
VAVPQATGMGGVVVLPAVPEPPLVPALLPLTPALAPAVPVLSGSSSSLPQAPTHSSASAATRTGQRCARFAVCVRGEA